MKLSDTITFRKNSNNEIVVIADDDYCMGLFLYYVVMIGLGIADDELKEYDSAADAINKVGIVDDMTEFDEDEDYSFNFGDEEE